jgi:hypothetical protein
MICQVGIILIIERDDATALESFRAWKRKAEGQVRVSLFYQVQAPKLNKCSDNHQDGRRGKDEWAQLERKELDLESGEKRN